MQVFDKKLRSVVQMPLYVAQEQAVAVRRHRLIDLSPVDIFFGSRLSHDELVVRGPAGMGRGDRHEGTHVRKLTLATPGRRLKKLGRNQIPMDLAARRKTLRSEVGGALLRHRFMSRPYFSCHPVPSSHSCAAVRR